MPKGEPQKIIKYNWRWGITENAVDVEIQCIKFGGRWKRADGAECGMGLFFHYKRLQELLWPEDFHHRWSDLMLEEILKNRITTILGPKDSGKTHCALSKFGLTDYFCFPQETLILISSTDIRGLELRVWGDLKTMFTKAKARVPWLPGHLLDSKHAITTDSLKEDNNRDMRKGVVCIPCMSSGGSWLGLGKYVGIKQKRRRLLGDECFPAGSLVDTPQGKRPIESIKPGDFVWNAVGAAFVLATSARLEKSRVKITTRRGEIIICTPNHPFFTQKGWIKACNLSEEHYMLSFYEAMQIMHETAPKKEKVILQQCLFSELQTDPGMAEEAWGVHGEVSCEPSKAGGKKSQAHVGAESNEAYRESDKGVATVEGDRMEAVDSRRERYWSDKSRSGIQPSLSRCRMELSNQDTYETGERIPNLLQGGSCFSDCEAGDRAGRKQSQQSRTQSKGPQERKVPRGDWVDRVEVSEHIPVYTGEPMQIDRGSVVYNLQVAGHPSYSVNGFLVHNCQFMKPSYIESLANLNSGDFKGVFVGNPLGEGDPLDKLAEPKEGWGTEGDVVKTSTWENKFIEGKTLNLVGTDSPNFEHPQDPEPKYPFLINQRSIDAVVAFYGMDSLQYYSQCLGVRKPGLNARRVINKMMCKKFGAFDPAVWLNTRQTKVYGLDAAYGGLGGDRCVGIRLDFGPDVEGKIIVKVYPPDLVPVSVKDDVRLPEDQIADWVKNKCQGDGIPPDNVFYDATGRGSLGTSFARIWSAYVNPVEFGGKPTDRSVSTSLKVRDLETEQMRLKRCDEHYSKFVTELWYSVRYVIEARQMRELPLDVMEEGCRREWKMVKGDKIEIETKEEMKLRVNISPDLFDALATAIEGARRLGFFISTIEAQKPRTDDDKWKNVLKERAAAVRKRSQLTYA